MSSVNAFDVFTCPLEGTRLIEASAGTGKTWNLCGLYLRLLLEQRLAVQEILVVTFTNAATAELRERIRARIAETLAHLRGTGAARADAFVAELLDGLRSRQRLADEDMALLLDLALQSFDEASIFTIHGFCQRALAEAPFSAGMPMQLTLLADDSDMRLAVVHDFWRRRLAGETLRPELAAHLLERKDTPASLSALLARRIAKPLSRLRWPEALDTPPALPDPASLHAAWARARTLWLAERERIVGIARAALPRLNQSRYSPAALDQAAAAWDQMLAREDAALRPEDAARLALLGEARLQANKGKAPVKPHAFFGCAQQLLALRSQRDEALALQRLQLLRELLEHGPGALRQAKRELRLTAFDDMLYNLHQRLQSDAGGALATLLRKRFKAALIDEFQDTDPLQFAIFQAIYDGSATPLFLVGDPKQAIYSFRNADLHTYLRARGQALAEYTLAHNQRSTQPLLDGLNALFSANVRAFMLPGLDYRTVSFGDRPRAALRESAQPRRAALQLWRLPRGRDGQPLHKDAAMALALQACAGEIARLLAASRRGEIALGERALAAGDIAVLVRSHAHGSAMRQALARAGVGSVELSMASIFDSIDAAELETVLAAVLEPTRLPLLRAALATGLMGRDADGLLALADDEDALLAVVGRFAGYREAWLQRGVGLMLRRWMLGEGVSARLLARPDGERRLTNLLHLADLLQQAAESQAAPEAVQRWLQTRRGEKRRDDAAQLRLESDRDLVQVVTIHKSKGLEYAIVFCPTLWDGASGRARSGEGLEYHDDDGDAVQDLRALDKAQRAPIAERIKLEAAAESMRLIYVALTRAVQRCVVVVGTYRRKHGKSLSATESCRARLHWLVAGGALPAPAWLTQRLTPDDIDAAWAALARQHAPQVALDELPQAPFTVLAAAAPAPERLAALAPPQRIAPAWWIGSYSSLAHGARHEAAARDHDLRAGVAEEDLRMRLAPGETPAETPLPDAEDILRFPRGAVAGECLHALLESIRFDDASGWPAAIDTALARFAHALSEPAARAAWPRMLLRWLRELMHTVLPGGLRLADVTAQRMQAELEFHLPAPQLNTLALGELLRREGYAVPALAFGSLAGYLRGFIDLVFEQHGRYYVLDWKSNHLGYRPADYGESALARVMDEQGYQLQALLYALALHRHLRRRLPDYEHQRHFGGVLYLFVRGVRPAWTSDGGTAAGVHAQRPSLRTLERLSALLDGAQAGA